MKIALKLMLLIIFAGSFVVYTSCDKAQITEAENTEDMSSEPNQILLKTTGTYDCYGWAVHKTLLEQYEEYLEYIPPKEFSTTSNRYDACIIQWTGNHAGYIMYQTSYYIKVSEWWMNGEQVNYYYPPSFNHPDAGSVKYWWEKDPPPLLVSISGPTYFDSHEIGTFTANPKDGAGTYSNYRWWKRNDEEWGEPYRGGVLSGDVGIMLPPTGEWLELDEWEGHKTIRFFVWYNFSLKCRVYDVWGATAEDIHQVIVE